MTRVPADRDEEPENSGESKIPTRFLSGEEATQLEHDGRSHAPPGISRIGPFQIERELGRGGMGAVYLARDPGLGREVALKVISAAEFASSTDRKRFRREAEVAAGIQHPHVVRVYQSGEEGGLLYFTMDYVEGRSLKARVEEGDLSPEGAALLVQKVALAVSHLHEHGIVHRDLKPPNPSTRLELSRETRSGQARSSLP